MNLDGTVKLENLMRRCKCASGLGVSRALYTLEGRQAAVFAAEIRFVH